MVKKQEKTSVKIRECPVVYVGMGPAGLLSFSNEAHESAIGLESEASYLGRASESALHLIDSGLNSELLRESETLGEILVRWEREWVSPDKVDWNDKEWSQVLPQWNFYFKGQKKIALWNSEKLSTIHQRISYSSPVNSLKQEGDAWLLQTPHENILAKKIVWAAGIRAFQNAYGKMETQDFLQANPNFNDSIREFLGGISLTWTFPERPAFTESFPANNVWALPVKHEKKYYLALGALHQSHNAFHLSTLTYLPDEIVQNPKELSSFHKSLKRVIKSQLAETQSPFQKETLIHNPHLMGHSLGLHWLFKDNHRGIHFIGDETHRASINHAWGLNSLQEVSNF